MKVIMTSPPIVESQMGGAGSLVAGFKGWGGAVNRVVPTHLHPN